MSFDFSPAPPAKTYQKHYSSNSQNYSLPLPIKTTQRNVLLSQSFLPEVSWQDPHGSATQVYLMTPWH